MDNPNKNYVFEFLRGSFRGHVGIRHGMVVTVAAGSDGDLYAIFVKEGQLCCNQIPGGSIRLSPDFSVPALTDLPVAPT